MFLTIFNNVILWSRCFFAQQKCRDYKLTVLHPGQCIQSTIATPDHTTDSQSLSTNDVTVASNPIFMTTTATVSGTTSDIIYKVFCANKDQLGCPSGLDPYCGTDNTFYNNEYVSCYKLK